jgi:hypothetical protein
MRQSSTVSPSGTGTIATQNYPIHQHKTIILLKGHHLTPVAVTLGIGGLSECVVLGAIFANSALKIVSKLAQVSLLNPYLILSYRITPVTGIPG